MEEDHSQDSSDGREDPSSGPVRSKASDAAGLSKNQVAAPVKSACTFCRSRKSRCNGKQPCAACINRGRTDDCVYTISRRGGKPKPKGDQLEPLEAHLEKLLGLSEIPHLVRIPNMMPHLQPFQQDQGNDFDPYQGINPSQMTGAASLQQQGFAPSVTSPATMFAPQAKARAGSLPMADTAAPPSAKSLVMDYYTYIYRFVPILPAPRYLDTLASSIQQGSPLLLSLQCVVPILRDQPLLSQAQPPTTDEAKKDAIRAEAQFYARQAYDAIDDVLERVENQQDKEDASILEIIQALCILVIYEYGSGRALKSRLKVDAALTLAMSKGLHRLSSGRPNNVDSATSSMGPGGPHYLTRIPDEELFEVRKRLWWTLWMLAMWTAYNTGRIPTVRADDSRVTSELPSCPDGPVNLWSNVVSSLQGLLLVQDRVLALAHIETGRAPVEGTMTSSGSAGGTHGFGSPVGSEKTSSGVEIPPSFSGQPTLLSRDDILRSMVELDAALQEQMRVLEQSTHGIVGPASNAQDANEDETQRILKFLWAIQVYTTSLTLHIGQAFQGATLFERKLCFLSSISEANDAAVCQVPMPNVFDDGTLNVNTAQPVSMTPTQDLYARGPFLPRESLKRCVDASDKLLSISRNLRRSEGHMASPNPFNACSFVLISFVCLMQALAISSNAQEEDMGIMTGSDAGENGNSSSQATQGSLATSTLLRSAQSAAALTPATVNGHGGQSPTTFFGTAAGVTGSQPSRQSQLQQIWARVKEAKDALQGLSRYWDMVIPMREEVSGCLEASQFLLSQQPQPAAGVSYGMS